MTAAGKHSAAFAWAADAVNQQLNLDFNDVPLSTSAQYLQEAVGLDALDEDRRRPTVTLNANDIGFGARWARC